MMIVIKRYRRRFRITIRLYVRTGIRHGQRSGTTSQMLWSIVDLFFGCILEDGSRWTANTFAKHRRTRSRMTSQIGFQRFIAILATAGYIATTTTTDTYAIQTIMRRIWIEMWTEIIVVVWMVGRMWWCYVA